MSAFDSDAAFDALMDDMQVLYSAKAGQTLTQDDVDALNRLDKHWREEDERATDAYHRGWTDGLRHAGGDALVKTQEAADLARSELVVHRALSRFDHQRGFRNGAAACREVMARFVEQGGDAVTANSIRQNWNPAWGANPQPPEDVDATTPASDGEGASGAEGDAKPTEPNINPKQGRQQGGEG